MILIPLTNKSLFDCFKAGSLNWNQSPSNADTQDSCQSLPLPDNVYFDETSSAGKLYWCLSRVYYCSESCMPHGFCEYFSIKGSIVFVSNEISSSKQDWVMFTNTLFAMTFVNQTYRITLLSAVDLDVFNVRRI